MDDEEKPVQINTIFGCLCPRPQQLIKWIDMPPPTFASRLIGFLYDYVLPTVLYAFSALSFAWGFGLI